MLNSYQEAINYIHSLPKFHRTNSLDRIKSALKCLNNPQNDYPTIHVTGTNGKGSTCNYLSNLLEADGLRVGMFTSPFIKVFNERIQISHEMISNDDLLSLTNEIVLKKGSIELSEFEFVTCLGFLYFRNRVDVAIIEVGIGAAHDKTNVINPDVSIITSIEMDHEQLIGPTLQDIAIEKSGIIKENTPLVTGLLPDSVRNIILNRANQLNSDIFEYNHELKIKNLVIDDFKIHFEFKDVKIECAGIEKTSAINALVAIQAFICFEKKYNREYDLEKIVKNIDSRQILARLQVVQKNPLIILDGAHNLAAIDNLINSLITNEPNKDIIVLYAGMKDKDRSDILEFMSNNTKEIFVTTLDMPRAAKEEDYDLSKYSNISYVEDYLQYLDMNKKKLMSNQILLVTGSFYLVSELETYFV
ncbi:bifunctional folylpolyglutamate synthase/dihydrofolate synthase [Companilactobacillus allii]|uniref:tetrahydrofolate synthase n=1 Tax=Companilactobacillus allii TaxID=1847728 RepID=A0A1P8Q5G2_9LACO|nr:folylpolyglutamate synthase/dihydrofolate synthase family protein [Companilactobacillus allii]APX73065.1 bifunctional folylpolyglutamate synthase/dihydrofolate synthase [Companilactobacillus allii]USQ67866.1 bifunctional folylpolyglutamate synthase/dihydrofolate synthase [Companilactobacillus allii]